MDLRPPLKAALDAFGLPATVTPPGGPTVQTTAVWLPPVTVDQPTTSDLRRAEPRRVLALPLAEAPQVPRDTVVSVPEHKGAVAADWKVDEAERIDFDHWRMMVVPA
ncbi:hypothetical protein LCGC14_1434940 [marine sediment metagenome]|uniref:Uncharacterized protein n=1 Tax=marine sediment metagenome TaxID=412755 RepID=A0A0F9K8M7_9ZZZZ